MSNEYSIAVVPLSLRLPETVLMWKAHWDEQGEEEARGLVFNPDIEGFLEAERRGWFAYIAVQQNGILVGHFGLSFSKNRQTNLMVAGDDFLYLAPEHRKGLLASRLIRFARDLAFEKGAVEFGISFRTFGSVDLSPLLRRNGMAHIANVYSTRR